MPTSEFDSPLTIVFEAAPGGSSSDSSRTGPLRETTAVQSWSITSDYMVSTDGFEFTLIDEDPANLRGLEGLPVKLIINGAVQVFGRIDETECGSSGSTAVTCRGRDYIADLVECNIDPTFTIKEGETLGSVILRACGPVGITEIDPESSSEAVIDARRGVGDKAKSKGAGQNGAKSKDDATFEKSAARKRNLDRLEHPEAVQGSMDGPFALPGTLPKDKKPAPAPAPREKPKPSSELTLQDFKPNIGQGIYEFLKPICDRHYCTLQPSTRRNALLVSAPLYQQDPSNALFRLMNDVNHQNNIVSGIAKRNYSSFPTLTIVQGHGSPRHGEATSTSTQLIDTWAEAQQYGGELAKTLDSITWSGRRKPDEKAPLPVDKIYRLNVFRDDKARSKEQMVRTAKRLYSEHLKKTLEYTVTVRGHIDPATDTLWAINTMVQVDDDVCGIHERLWVQSRTFRYDGRGGATTEMLLIRPDTFDFSDQIKEVANAGAGKKRDDSFEKSEQRRRNLDRLQNPQNVVGAMDGPLAILNPTFKQNLPPDTDWGKFFTEKPKKPGF